MNVPATWEMPKLSHKPNPKPTAAMGDTLSWTQAGCQGGKPPSLPPGKLDSRTQLCCLCSAAGVWLYGQRWDTYHNTSTDSCLVQVRGFSCSCWTHTHAHLNLVNCLSVCQPQSERLIICKIKQPHLDNHRIWLVILWVWIMDVILLFFMSLGITCAHHWLAHAATVTHS